MSAASVHTISTMLAMAMTPQIVELRPRAGRRYVGSGQLAMGGEWGFQVIVALSAPSRTVKFDFKATISP